MDYVHRSDRSALERGLSSAVRSGARFEMDLRLAHPVDRYRWHLFRAAPHNEAGADGSWVYVLTDIHERKLVNRDLAEKSRWQEDMLNASIDCIKVINPDGTLVYMNKAGCVALNVAEDSDFGMDWINLLPEEVHEPGRKALANAVAGQHARFPGVSHLPGESTQFWDNMLTPLRASNNEVKAILCVSRNVTVEREGERQIELLLHELNHRSKNMLTVIQALIRRSVPDPDADFVRSLERRIAAIARSQDVVIGGQWTGANVRDVILSQAVAAGNVAESRLRVDGDADLRIKPKAAEVLGLAIHELTTNAIKYGAFSNEVGTVAIAWSIEGADTPHFHMTWAEAGGPKVVPPSRRGFGSVVIESNPSAALRANVELKYYPAGLVWDFSAPIGAVLAE